MRLQRTRRPGTILVESALVYPVVFVVVLGIILLGYAVFRYQQVAHLAREASRWASVHGKQYATETGNTAATAADVYTNAVVPQAAGMQADKLTCAVAWDQSNSPTRMTTVNGQAVKRSNTVRVTVTYTWNTGLFGTIPVSSTSVSTMSF
jgi:Flp pilus assembly protein TadG